jgi:quercetin dioxygenase-like cupin family protein
MMIRLLTALLMAATPASAQALKQGWAPKPVAAPATGQLHWKLADLVRAHAGQKSWSQTLVREAGGLTGTYIQTAPGEVSPRRMYSDSVILFAVQSGRLRVVIDGVEPFIATPGVLVQVPSLRFFHVETLDAPARRFEVTQTLAPPVFAADATPAPQPGTRYVRVGYYSPSVPYGDTKPATDYRTDAAPDGVTPVVQDDFLSARITRGRAAQGNTGDAPEHFHIGASETWLVLEGQVRYRIEGRPEIVAGPGDVVLAPAGLRHASRFAGHGAAAQLSILPVADALEALAP